MDGSPKTTFTDTKLYILLSRVTTWLWSARQINATIQWNIRLYTFPGCVVIVWLAARWTLAKSGRGLGNAEVFVPNLTPASSWGNNGWTDLRELLYLSIVDDCKVQYKSWAQSPHTWLRCVDAGGWNEGNQPSASLEKGVRRKIQMRTFIFDRFRQL